MKLQYKSAGLMVLSGMVILFFSIVFYSNHNRQVVLKKELNNVRSLSIQVAQHLESHLISAASIAGTISSGSDIHDALLKSNLKYDALTIPKREVLINELSHQWKNAKDINDPFIQKHLTNSVAEFLKKQQMIIPGYYGEIFLTNRYGVMIGSTGKLTTLAHAHKYWWQAAYNNGEGRVFFDDRGFDTSVDGYVIGVVIPVKQGDEIIGILKCNINIMGSLTDVIQNFDSNHLGKIQIARTKGLIVAEKGKIPLSSELHDDVVRYLLTKKSDAKLFEVNKKNELIGFSPMKITLGSKPFGFGGSHETIDHIKGNKSEAWHVVISLDEEVVIKETEETTRFLIIFGLIFIALTALIALVFGKWIAKPLVKLVDTTQKISEGQLDVRVSITTKDEVGVLGMAFNNMVENLSKTLVSREYVDNILTSMADMLIVVDSNGKIKTVNQATLNLLGYEEQEVIGKPIELIIIKEEEEEEEEDQGIFHGTGLQILIEKGFIEGIERTYQAKNGRKIPVLFSGSVMRDKNGGIQGIVCMGQDITERKQAEETLRENHTRHANMIENIGDVIGIVGADGMTKYQSPNIEKWFGWKPEDIIGTNGWDKIHPEDNERIQKEFTKILEKETASLVEYRFKCKEGKYKWIELTAVNRINDPLINGVLLNYHDITERKQAESVLETERRRLADVIEGTNVGTWEWNIQTGETIFNEHWAEIVGYTLKEISPVSIKTWERFSHPLDLKISNQLLEEHFNGEIEFYEFEGRMRHKNGKWIWVQDRGKVSTWTDDGKPLILSGTHQEITERKQAEEQIKASLKEKETLLQEIHHRVKNNMSVISGLLHLQMNSTDNQIAKEALQDSQNRVQSMSMIHETLYRSDNLADIDLATYLSDLGKVVLQNYAISKTVHFKVKAESVMIDSKLASTVGLIVNELIANSLKYAFTDDREGEILLELKSNKENGVELMVSDNGVGIPEGFDLKNADSLGLKLVKMLVENQLDGSVDMEKSNGTKFTIKFDIQN
jgi:PAS domain S-box-containing protein